MNDRLVSLALDIGEQMLKSGGEVSRVENTIERILTAYRFQKIDVFSITSEIQVTAISSDGHVYNQLRRIHKIGTDLSRLEDLNQVSRDICAERPDPDTAREMLRRIDRRWIKKHSPGVIATSYIGAVFCSSGFTVFFGGGPIDAALAAVLACIITWITRHTSYRKENQLLYYFFYSVITGIVGTVLAELCGACGVAVDLDKVLIGCIMLTIPGVAITYSVRDMLLGDTITGMMRFLESLLTASSIAGGFIVSAMFSGGIIQWIQSFS